MRAAVYQGNQQFAIEDLADPAPAPGQVVVDVEFCAICGTDVHAVMYDIAPVGSVLGHEYSGVISRVGSGVERWRVGDRVVGGEVSHHPRWPRPGAPASTIVTRGSQPSVFAPTQRKC